MGPGRYNWVDASRWVWPGGLEWVGTTGSMETICPCGLDTEHLDNLWPPEETSALNVSANRTWRRVKLVERGIIATGQFGPSEEEEKGTFPPH